MPPHCWVGVGFWPGNLKPLIPYDYTLVHQHMLSPNGIINTGSIEILGYKIYSLHLWWLTQRTISSFIWEYMMWSSGQNPDNWSPALANVFVSLDMIGTWSLLPHPCPRNIGKLWNITILVLTRSAHWPVAILVNDLLFLIDGSIN